jgi:hypothetical protein
MPELTTHSTPISNPLPPSLLAVPPHDPTSPSAPPPATAQGGNHGVAAPPIIDPASWEDYPIFRESFLMYITEPKHNAALRTAGDFLFTMVLEQNGNWPSWTESSTRTELRAALADLRHLQGFLTSVGREHRLSSLSLEDTTLSQSAARIAVEVGKLASRIEHELATGQRDVQ